VVIPDATAGTYLVNVLGLGDGAVGLTGFAAVDEGTAGIDVAARILGADRVARYAMEVAASGEVSFAFLAETDVPRQIRKRWPSPTFGRASIQWEVAERADGELAVYDVNGRRVAILAEGSMEAGIHKAEFTYHMDGVARLNPGLYFVRLRVGADVAVARTVVLGGRP
jgi:hypothetical protein